MHQLSSTSFDKLEQVLQELTATIGHQQVAIQSHRFSTQENATNPKTALLYSTGHTSKQVNSDLPVLTLSSNF